MVNFDNFMKDSRRKSSSQTRVVDITNAKLSYPRLHKIIAIKIHKFPSSNHKTLPYQMKPMGGY